MRVLVTGHRGFVGRHFHQHLAGLGHDVHGCDIVDGNDCRELFRSYESPRFDLVIHCAAVVGGRQTIEGKPLLLACEDLSIDAELFRWALRTKPGRIVYFSSAAAYGTHHQAARSEVTDLNEREHMGGAPDQSYGTVKRMGEVLATMANAAGITTHVFRPFSGYGEDQSLDYPFPSILERVARREDPLIVWSDAVRDFVHIDDIVGCVLTMIGKPVMNPMNICTGRATSFGELARMAAAQAGYEPAIELAAGKPKGVHRRVGDATRMLDHYRPTVPLEAGIRRALNALEAR